jgi:hypothetical protein
MRYKVRKIDRSSNGNLGFEVLTAVIMKSTIFWDIMPCSPLKVNRWFGREYRLHLQGQRISRAINQWASRLTFNELDGVISQKTVILNGILGAYPSRSMNVCVISVFMLFCVWRDLAMGRSSSQEVQSNIYRIHNFRNYLWIGIDKKAWFVKL